MRAGRVIVNGGRKIISRGERRLPPKNNYRLLSLLPQNRRQWTCLLDSLFLSRHGESSSELVSVMILDPTFGNSLWKVAVCRTVNIT
jgi:hypothetical protein